MLENTLIGFIVKNADEMPQAVAMREKRYGVWSPTTWLEFRDKVQRFALGLLALGFKPGDNLTVVGDNKPEWIIAEFGCMAAGGVPTGVYPASMAEEVEYLITYSESTFLVVRDQEQTDKVLTFWENIKDTVEKVVVWDSRGMSHYYAEYPFLERFETVLELGAKEEETQKDFLSKRAREIDPTKPAMMLTTSGTTAKPKLSMLSHENLIFASQNYGKVAETKKGDELMSIAPLAWIGEQAFVVSRFLTVGAHYNFPEETETVRRDLLELQPFYFGGTPAVWELLISTIQAAIDNADFVKRFFYHSAITTALKCAEADLAGTSPGLWNRLLYPILNFSVLRPLKNKMGLGRVQMAITGGGAISPEVFKYFKAFGMDLRQVYGQSECTGIATTHRKEDVRPETVGVPIPEVEVKVSEDGEILVKGKNVHLGYYKREEASREALTDDGYLRTGDNGYFDKEGHLYVFDRTKDIMTIDDGTRFAPQDIETRLKFSAYIRDVMVIGDGKPHVTAIVSIDLENVGNWAKKRGISYTTVQDLSQREEVYDLIEKEIKEICRRFPENIRVKRFANLIKELHPDDGELTRTNKVRRGVVNDRYVDLIEALYHPQNPQHDLDIQVRYEDGRVSNFKGTVILKEVA
ncbi:MAG: long-chain fatty acid--CoA ligase [Proteobacteria bacterium]|nr:long-chain fatty acid--CoA ligase [Pseudomonadota bacterium]